jgi:signal transduction histidine kinase
MEALLETNKALRILCLEDVRKDAELLNEMITDEGLHVSMDIALGENEYISFLKEFDYDVILADYNLPSFNAPSALKLAQSLQPDVPFICVSGSIGEEQAVELLKLGATDYILKDRLSRLSIAIQRALEGAEKQKAKTLAEVALKVSEENLRKLNEDLESKVKARTIDLENSNKALEAFSHSVSHDLRAPLRAIMGFSDILSDTFSDQLGKEGSRLVKVIVDNTVRMDNLIKGLIELSKMDQGILKNDQIDMNQTVQVCIQENVPKNDREKVTFTIGNLSDIQGDPTLIKQVWVNLIENAVKYSKNKEKPTITIQSGHHEGQIVYSVKDNGVGFNPEYQRKLFQMFQRLHNSNDFEGTGIGLAIVQRIIHRHGGKVWAEGIEGEGATLYFSLPTTEPEGIKETDK